MKILALPVLTLATGFVLTSFSHLQAEGSSTSAGAAIVSPPVSVAPVTSTVVTKVYLTLVRDSLVPADPRAVATAVLAALPSESSRILPADFGADAERDAAWLADRVKDLPPPWLALEAMVRATNIAHTRLVTPKRLPGMRALGSGRPLSAPGFQLFPLKDGSLGVTDLIPGASAVRAGLQAGDVVRRIADQVPVRSDTFWLATQAAGTVVEMKVERAGRPLSLTLQLEPADVSSVESRMLDDKIAYVKIRWFARTAEADRDTATLVRRALVSLAEQGARGLILDLRSALGGSGEVSIASAIYDGDVIYSIRQPLTAPAKPYPREGTKIWPDRPVAVLVNELTVSAGEDLALVLRELGHALIVGQTTGGGLTEFSRLPLGDGYLLIYPTGMVFGPVTDALQPDYAVKPDIEISNPDLAEFLSGRDRQLEAARAALVR